MDETIDYVITSSIWRYEAKNRTVVILCEEEGGGGGGGEERGEEREGVLGGGPMRFFQSGQQFLQRERESML